MKSDNLYWTALLNVLNNITDASESGSPEEALIWARVFDTLGGNDPSIMDILRKEVRKEE